MTASGLLQRATRRGRAVGGLAHPAGLAHSRTEGQMRVALQLDESGMVKQARIRSHRLDALSIAIVNASSTHSLVYTTKCVAAFC
jgi:hypothetical protein